MDIHTIPAIREIGMRVDWPTVIGQCKATKLSLRGIAYLTGLSTASIHNLSAGTVEPLHEHGERVIAFWSQCTGKTRDGLPTIPQPTIECVVQCAEQHTATGSG